MILANKLPIPYPLMPINSKNILGLTGDWEKH
ncbi:hypothetical protein PSAR109036_06655 [Psychrobacter arenosus]